MNNIKLRIIKIEGYNYYFEDEFGNNSKINIEFYDLPNKPIVHDYLVLNEEVLREKNIMLNLGVVDNIDTFCKENAILISNNKEIYLKRYYG